jgi:hypothetical protein
VINPNYNYYGLSLSEWCKLCAGGTIEGDFKEVHPKLFDFVYVIKKKEKKNG